METDYNEVMSKRTNEELFKILTREKDQYQPEAIEAARNEFEKRGLNLSDFLKASTIGQYSMNSSISQTQSYIESMYDEERKKQANKDMLYGALWCVGGLVATMADIGFIFWGAIVFGAVQFFKGLINSQSS